MEYAKAHVADGVLRVDPEGRIWRCKILHRDGYYTNVKERRAEHVGGKGYLRVSLHVPIENRLAIVMAHCLVYEVLVGPIPSELQINHEDLDKKNNHPLNLKQMTGAENIQHSYANGRIHPWTYATDWRGKPVVTDDIKAAIKARRSQGVILRLIADEFSLSTTHVHRICQEEL